MNPQSSNQEEIDNNLTVGETAAIVNETTSEVDEWELHLQQEEIRKLKTAKTDIIAGVVLIFIGAVGLIRGLNMPVEQFTGDMSKWYGAPGVFPILLSGLIIVFSISLIINGFRHSGGIKKSDVQGALNYFKSAMFFRLLIILALLAIYIFGMLNRMNYYVSTFIFLAATMLIFQPKAESRKKQIISIVSCLIISGIVAFVVGYGFGTLAQIPLP